jgi:hypothetical protein
VNLIAKTLLGLAVAALPALCGPISITNQWTAFGWSGSAPTNAFGGSSGYSGSLGTTVLGTTCVGSSPCDSFSQPFTFTGPATFTIQDLFSDGDRFNIFIDGSLTGTASSVPANDGTACGNDPAGCVGNAKFSSGSISISGAGAHSISISVTQEATGVTSGQAVFKLAASGGGAVPEPTTLSLMGLGLGGLFLGWRGRKKA